MFECERGFRASQAYPTRIFVPADTRGTREQGGEELVEGLSTYRVPVELLPARCADAPSLLEREQV